MIIYEVNIKLNANIVNEFDEWLDKHINKMLQFEGFTSAKKLNSIQNEKFYITVQYNIISQEDLDRYLRNYANNMQNEIKKIFEGQFNLQRRIMKTIKTYP